MRGGTRYGRPIADRFWEKVDRRGPDECWPWIRYRNHEGYGHFAITPGRVIGAHRAVWELTVGSIPNGLHVLHRCDNPPCVNPEHLFLGTNADNVQDSFLKKRRKNRPRSGEQNNNAVLTEAAVREIRQILADGTHKRGTQSALARRFRVSVNLISLIKKGRIWRHAQ
jgi:hypothetical protein